MDGFDRLSAHALRVGFITAAYDKGVRDEDIMRHTRHRDLRTMRGYVQRAGRFSPRYPWESETEPAAPPLPAGLVLPPKRRGHRQPRLPVLRRTGRPPNRAGCITT